MQVIATAGHVDHGKSALVHELTGMQPDRWDEERRRGLTIGLGFAWTTLADGQVLAFVDVPGHERFVPTMLAGVGPVPAVLFVVAADEGWMPQSAEHLAALDAFGVQHGLLAVTRADLADPEPARRQAHQAMAGSTLAGVPSVAVSSATGAGLGELRDALAHLVAGLPAADPGADVRLWVDRSFMIDGAGSVVTGTLSAGTLRTGDELRVASSGLPVRVRGMQTLARSSDEIRAVARVAVNLRSVDRDDVRHGDALLSPDSWLSTDTVDVATGGADPGDLRGELVAHLGAAAVPTHMRPLGRTTARLRLRRPLPLRARDRLLLRDPAHHRVAARADVLDVRPQELRRRGAPAERGRRLDALADGDLAALTDALLTDRGAVQTAELRAMGLARDGHQVIGDWHVTPATWDRWRDELRALLAAWRSEHPLLTGVPTQTARRKLGLPNAAALARLAADAGLTVVDGTVTDGQSGTLPTDVRTAVEAVVTELGRCPFEAPAAGRLAELGLGTAELAAAERAGLLWRVTDQVVLLPDADATAVDRLAKVPQPFTVSAAKRALGTTRRVAVPLLERLDQRGWTVRLTDGSRRLHSSHASRASHA